MARSASRLKQVAAPRGWVPICLGRPGGKEPCCFRP
jgi:hypothetical protein